MFQSGWVYLDPVIAHGSVDLGSGAGGHDDRRRLNRHVAANTARLDHYAYVVGFGASLPTVTREARCGVARRLAFGLVDVVTRGAGHARRLAKAAAALEQTDLVSVNVRVLRFWRWKSLEVFAERPSWKVGKSGFQSYSLEDRKSVV